MDVKLVDKTVRDVCDQAHSYLLYMVRNEAGVFPVKIRTTVFTPDGDGNMHNTEIETLAKPPDECEADFQEIVKAQALKEARRLLVKGEEDDGETKG